MSFTRLDIAFSIRILSRFTSNPGKSYWDAVQRLMRYLKETLNLSLLYTEYPVVIEGFSIQVGVQNQMSADPLKALSSSWVELLFHESLRSKL